MAARNAIIKYFSPSQQPLGETEQTNASKVTNKDSLWCTYCKKPRHTRERCWKLHGKPPMSNKNSTMQNGQPKGQGQAHMTSTQSGDEVKSHEPDKLNREEIEKLKSLLGALEKPPETGTCSLAFKSKFSSLYALNVSCTTFPNSWVIDSGATDHMTHSSHKFITYDPCLSNRKISTADGSLSTIAGQGNVLINQALTLKNVLHVPNLSTNLLSIHKLTKDLNCNVIFYPSYCIF